jgi:FO synthase subunit 2
VLRMYAVSRIMLHGVIDHVQASWVKQGISAAQACLQAGADDFGGTLMNESISTSAGASQGHFQRPADIRHAICALGRWPAERSTTYNVLREFQIEPETPDTLDSVESEARFGSYHAMISSPEFRFVKRSR